MAVLIEGLSIVIKVSSILEKFSNNIDEFNSMIPNKTECSDNELFRVGFMMPSDAKDFIKSLETKGFIYLKDNLCQDIVPVDQNGGFLNDCNWAKLYKYELTSNQHVVGCRLKKGKETKLFFPNFWEYETSLYTSGQAFYSEKQLSEKMTFLDKEDNVSRYINNDTGEIVYLGRTKK